MALTTATNEFRVRDNNTFALSPAKSINAYQLVANTPVNINVSDLTDANSKKANALIFSCTGNFYILWNGSNAAVPSSNITDGTAPELNPSVRRLGGNITQFSIVAPANCVLTLSIFTLIN